jgi:hypothetical protein
MFTPTDTDYSQRPSSLGAFCTRASAANSCFLSQPCTVGTGTHCPATASRERAALF